MKIQRMTALAAWFIGSLAICGTAVAQVAVSPSAEDGPEEWAAFSRERAPCREADMPAILAFLRGADGGNPELASIKNNLLGKLVGQTPCLPGLGAQLLDLYRDRSVSVITRDFTLQHFAPFLLNLPAKPGNGAVAASIVVELRGAVSSGEGMIPGSALLALESLASAGVYCTSNEVGELGARIAADKRRDPGIRATAMQVAANAGRREVLNTARDEAEGAGPLSLRLSAVACMAKLGGAEDRRRLAAIADRDPSAYVRSAAGKQPGRDGKDNTPRENRASEGGGKTSR